MRPISVGLLPLILLAAVAAHAQDPLLERLKRESARVKAQPDVAMKPLREAFVDWIDARLPADKCGLSVGAPFLESVMLAELKPAGLTAPDDDAEARSGSLGLALTWLKELPDVLFVTAGIGVHCGVDDAVYMYRFDPRGRVRLLADHPKSEWGYYRAAIEISEPDTDQRRLLLLRYQSVQCASFWMGMAYTVYRLDPLPAAAETLLARNQGFYLRPDGNLFVLEPNRLTIEFANRSVDMFVHNRTFLQRFDFTHGAERIAPLALNPRVFAEEWLTSPWNDVGAWSTPGAEPDVSSGGDLWLDRAAIKALP